MMNAIINKRTTTLGLIVTGALSLSLLGFMLVDLGFSKTAQARSNDPGLAVTTEVVQDKILKGGDGQVAVSLHLSAAYVPPSGATAVPPADLVIVLDRSGSMKGRKLHDARQAVIQLLDWLRPEDRLALISYANDVSVQAVLTPVNSKGRLRLRSAVSRIQAGGGTNLGGGLRSGMDLLAYTPGMNRQRKLILISDGLANQGVTDPYALGAMASSARESGFTISTLGVGLDFNELLMSAIADQGAGSYYFLEDPLVMNQVFETELSAARRVAASDVQIRVQLRPGVRLLSAGGYPIRYQGDAACIFPGNVLAGQHRNLYLVFQAPTVEETTIELAWIQVQYQQQGEQWHISLPDPLTVACVDDPAEALGSIKKDVWADQVVQEEFSRLKEAVAADIREGNREKAQSRIREYETRQSTINSVVGSGKVSKNLDEDVQALRRQVDETFAGAPAAVAEKKKQVSKSLQYEGYKQRRDQE